MQNANGIRGRDPKHGIAILQVSPQQRQSSFFAAQTDKTHLRGPQGRVPLLIDQTGQYPGDGISVVHGDYADGRRTLARRWKCSAACIRMVDAVGLPNSPASV